MILFQLKRAILESGLKQAFIARQIGLDDTTLSKKLHGYRPMTDNEKRSIAKLLRKNVCDLFPQLDSGAGNPKP